MMISKYKGKKITSEYYNEWRQWPEPNIITSMDEFNQLLLFMHNNCKLEKLTSNGHLKKTLYNQYIQIDNGSHSLTYLLDYKGTIYLFKFWPGYRPDKVAGVKGSEAWAEFRRRSVKWIGPYLMNNKEKIQAIKDTILKPLICLDDENVAGESIVFNKTSEISILHIDINSAYPAGVAHYIPESRLTWESIYEQKQNGDPKAKGIANLSIGTSQSLRVRGYVAPTLAYYGIKWTIEQLLIAAQIIKSLNGRVLCYNTDGIWFMIMNSKIPELKKQLDFGDGLGQWKMDHNVERIRFKSAGSYEYTEDGIYHAVVRGIPSYISNTFEWGDIFHHNIKGYKLIILPYPHLIEVEIEEAEIDVDTEDEV